MGRLGLAQGPRWSLVDYHECAITTSLGFDSWLGSRVEAQGLQSLWVLLGFDSWLGLRIEAQGLQSLGELLGFDSWLGHSQPD